MLIHTKSLKSILLGSMMSREFIDTYKTALKQDSLVDILSKVKTDINNYLISTQISFGNGLSTITKKAVDFVSKNMRDKIDNFRSSENLVDKAKLWIAENQQLLSTFAEKFYERMLSSVSQSITAVDSYSTLKSYLSGVLQSMIKRAKITAGSQISKLNLLVVKTLSIVNGMPIYQWLTQRDNKVRHTHKVLDSKYCQWSDATTYKNSLSDKKWLSRSSIGGVTKDVGADFNCRCPSRGVVA
jgi:uncharacterized protein with gpF-like domain